MQICQSREQHHCTLCGLIDGETPLFSLLDITFLLMTNREHDKGPEEFCSILTKLMDADLKFAVSVLGEHTNDVPGISSHSVLCTS